MTDTCDCVTFPDNILEITPCSGDAYWGTFQVQFTDGTCYDVPFDERTVYADCPSGYDPEAVTDYVLCDVDFTEGTDEDLPTSGELTATDTAGATPDTTSKKVASSDQAATPSLRQESTGAKKTRIHLTVHRLLTFVIEAVLALQSPST